ncbi:MAG TPA: response regulator [Rhizomicrobium sp.]
MSEKIGGTAPKALVADDETMLRFVACETLQDAGFKVTEAADGASALAILQSDSSIELLVSDIRMPGMNGIELAEAGLKLRPGLKVLLMTGYATESLPASLRERGLEILRKPFDLSDLSSRALSLVANGA